MEIDFISHKSGTPGNLVTAFIANNYDRYNDVWWEYDMESNRVHMDEKYYGSPHFQEASIEMYKWWVNNYKSEYGLPIPENYDSECEIELFVKNRMREEPLPTMLTTRAPEPENAKHSLICIEHPPKGIKQLYPNSKRIAIIPKNRDPYWSNYSYLVAFAQTCLTIFNEDWGREEYIRNNIKKSPTPRDVDRDVNSQLEWLSSIPEGELMEGTIRYGMYYNADGDSAVTANDEGFLYSKVFNKSDLSTSKTDTEHFREYTIDGFVGVSIEEAVSTNIILDILGLEHKKGYKEIMEIWHNRNLEIISPWI